MSIKILVFEHDWNSVGQENHTKILSYLCIARPEDAGVVSVDISSGQSFVPFVPTKGKYWSLAFARLIVEHFDVNPGWIIITDKMKQMCRDCFTGLPMHDGFVKSFLDGREMRIVYEEFNAGKLSTRFDKPRVVIESWFEKRGEIEPGLGNTPCILSDAITNTINGLNDGSLRVAEKIAGEWVTNEWLKKAVLLSFKVNSNTEIEGGFTNYFDKVPSKFFGMSEAEFHESGIRVVPPAVARHGSYIAPNVVLMPSYINIGAYIDEGTMIDTWATVGSCAQIGKNCHISGGAGIGGVLEPLQATPTIIEDNCFIGARSEIVEGVIVEEGSVISMGVFIGQSTKIYNRETGEIIYGRVPAFSVVVAGSLPSDDGSHSLNCAVIVKTVDAQTRAKTAPNELLRP